MSIVSNSVQPHRRQPTRLPCPWDSPGKNSGVGCHFLLQCTKVKSESEVTQSCSTLSDPTDCSLPGSSTHGILQPRVLEWGAIAFCEVWRTSNLRLSSLTRPVFLEVVKEGLRRRRRRRLKGRKCRGPFFAGFTSHLSALV